MADKIGYQSAEASGLEKRRGFNRPMIVTVCLIGLAMSLLAVVMTFFISGRPSIVRTTLTVKNTSLLSLTDSGCIDSANHRLCSTGVIAPGQTRQISFEFHENDFVAGFSFDQAGKTYSLKLDPDSSGEVGTFDINVSQAKVTASWGVGMQASTAPSIQPISYP